MLEHCMETISVRFFAGHRDIVGQSQIVCTIEPGTTVHVLWQRLAGDYPALQPFTNCLRYAVNEQFVEASTRLHDGDEVAYIPPVSGGNNGQTKIASLSDTSELDPFAVTEAVLEPAPLVRWVQTPSDGAVVTFAGVVRDNFAGRATSFLVYEAYTEMALVKLRHIAEETRAQYPIGRVAIHHRLGRIDIGETAVLVVVAAPHRQAAFEAAAYLMDRIKQVVPIWKCEYWSDGTSDWHHPEINRHEKNSEY